MKNSGKNYIFSLLLIISLFILTPAAYAQNNAFSKLGRGAANTLTGWLEIPKNIYEISSQKNPLMGISWGLAKGIGLGVARTGVGVYEVITFPFPIPESYEPIMKPEYVLGTE